MIAGGLALGLWAFLNNPFGAQASSSPVPGESSAATAPDEGSASGAASDSQAEGEGTGSAGAEGAPAPTELPSPPLLAVDLGDAPGSLNAAVLRAAENLSDTLLLTTTADSAPAIRFSLAPSGTLAYTVTYAVATRFDTLEPAISWQEMSRTWSSGSVSYTQIAVLSDTVPALRTILGEPGPLVRGYAATEDVVSAAWQDRTTLAILPFDQLEPRLIVFAVDGQNPIENSSHYTPTEYPLIADIYAEVTEGGAVETALARKALGALPPGNRLPEHLTVVAMTGVTAMCRQTAAQMDRYGAA